MVPTLQAAQEQEIGIVKALIEGRADVNKAVAKLGDPAIRSGLFLKVEMC